MPTATKQSQAKGGLRPTTAASKKRSPDPVHIAADGWNLTTRADGAVLATASAVVSDTTTTFSATLVPPSTQTSGVKTITTTVDPRYGQPVWKVTPFLFDTMDGQKMAFGNGSFSPVGLPPLEMLPAVAALRMESEFEPGDALDDTRNDSAVYTMRILDSVVTLDSGWMHFATTGTPATATLMPAPTSSASSAIAKSAHPSLPAGAIAGIAGGSALLLGVAGAWLYRRTQIAKRQAQTELFGQHVARSIELTDFTNV